jgi:hypothetical protein
LTTTAPRVGSALPFVPLGAVGQRPHIMVDGAARDGSMLVLSHWPHSPTPAAMWADLSAEIALSYVESSPTSPDAECVTIDHPDEDGIASVFVVAHPEEALRLKEPLVAFARAGDFGVASRDAARAVFAFQAIDAGSTPPWRTEAASPDWSASTGWFADLVPHLGEIIERPEEFEELWSDADRAFEDGIEAIARGDVTIEEHRDLDVAVVRVHGITGVRRLPVARRRVLRVHPFALHSATPMVRMIVLDGDQLIYYDRYETWVRYVSRDVPKRRDLAPLAAELNESSTDVVWEADGPGAIVAALCPREHSDTVVSQDDVVAQILEYLATAPVAWDPFAEPTIGT